MAEHKILLSLFKGYTDETVEDVWVSAQPPYDPVPFEGREDEAFSDYYQQLHVMYVKASGRRDSPMGVLARTVSVPTWTGDGRTSTVWTCDDDLYNIREPQHCYHNVFFSY